MVKFTDMPVEMLGRLPTRVTMNPPTAETMFTMLGSKDLNMWGMANVVLKQYGVDNFVVSDECRQYLADCVYRDEQIKPIGLRRLHSVITEIVKGYYLNPPDTKGNVELSKERIDAAVDFVRSGLE